MFIRPGGPQRLVERGNPIVPTGCPRIPLRREETRSLYDHECFQDQEDSLLEDAFQKIQSYYLGSGPFRLSGQPSTMLAFRTLPLPIFQPLLLDYHVCHPIYGTQIGPLDCQRVADTNLPEGTDPSPFYLRPGLQPSDAITLPLSFSKG